MNVTLGANQTTQTQTMENPATEGKGQDTVTDSSIAAVDLSVKTSRDELRTLRILDLFNDSGEELEDISTNPDRLQQLIAAEPDGDRKTALEYLRDNPSFAKKLAGADGTITANDVQDLRFGDEMDAKRKKVIENDGTNSRGPNPNPKLTEEETKNLHTINANLGSDDLHFSKLDEAISKAEAVGNTDYAEALKYLKNNESLRAKVDVAGSGFDNAGKRDGWISGANELAAVLPKAPATPETKKDTPDTTTTATPTIVSSETAPSAPADATGTKPTEYELTSEDLKHLGVIEYHIGTDDVNLEDLQPAIDKATSEGKTDYAAALTHLQNNSGLRDKLDTAHGDKAFEGAGDRDGWFSKNNELTALLQSDEVNGLIKRDSESASFTTPGSWMSKEQLQTLRDLHNGMADDKEIDRNKLPELITQAEQEGKPEYANALRYLKDNSAFADKLENSGDNRLDGKIDKDAAFAAITGDAANGRITLSPEVDDPVPAAGLEAMDEAGSIVADVPTDVRCAGQTDEEFMNSILNPSQHQDDKASLDSEEFARNINCQGGGDYHRDDVDGLMQYYTTHDRVVGSDIEQMIKDGVLVKDGDGKTTIDWGKVPKEKIADFLLREGEGGLDLGEFRAALERSGTETTLGRAGALMQKYGGTDRDITKDELVNMLNEGDLGDGSRSSVTMEMKNFAGHDLLGWEPLTPQT